MYCHRARALFSLYLDGRVTGRQMQAISAHLEECAGCRREYAGWQRTQQLLAGLGEKKAPPELALRLRVTLSQALAQRGQRRLESLMVRLHDFADAFMLPATAGLVSAVVFFGLLIGVLAIPERLAASSGDDVPTLLYTPPQLRALPPELGLGTMGSEQIVVETLVDANGRVQDYRILSGPSDDSRLQPELNNLMIFTTFRPATTFGVPTPGRAVLCFSKINVKG